MCQYNRELVQGRRAGAGQLNFGGKTYTGEWHDDAAAATAIPISIGPAFATGTPPSRSFWSRDPLKPRTGVSAAAGERVRVRGEEGEREVAAVGLQVELVVKHAQ